MGVIAVLESADGPQLVLQKQFRPPLNAICIEVPAGLVDEGETVEQCALRELYEETGYHGQLVKDATGSTPILVNSRYLCQTWAAFLAD